MANIECKKYVPKPGEKACVYYLRNGGCRHQGMFMCVEWERRNPHKAASVVAESGRPSVQVSDQPQVSSMFDTATAGTKKASPEENHLKVTHKPRQHNRLNDKDTRIAVSDLIAGLGLEAPPDESLDESLSGIGELEIQTDAGTIWIVRELTGQPRAELTFKSAAYLLLVMSMFKKSRLLRITPASATGEDI